MTPTTKQLIQWLQSHKDQHPDHPTTQNYITAIIRILNSHQKHTPSPTKHPLYQQYVATYNHFCLQKIGISATMTPIEGKALKNIITQLKTSPKVNQPQDALNAFEYILKYWHKLSPFIQKQIKLSQINKNLKEIIKQLKDGNSKIHNNHSQLQQLKDRIRDK